MSQLVVVNQDIGKVGKTSKMPSYAHRGWMDYQTTLGNIMAEFLFVRFNSIVAPNSPLALTYDATRGIWVVTSTYAAALKQSFGALSVQATGSYAVGDYDYVQVKGPNVVTVGSSAAMTAGLGVQHSAGADILVKECVAATLADQISMFAVLHKAQAGAGTIGIGEMAMLGRF